MTKDQEKYLEMVKDDGGMLCIVPVEMQTDEIIDAAIENDPWAFEYIKDDGMKTNVRCLDAVNRDGMMLNYVPVFIQTYEVIDAAMEEDIDAFMYIKDERKKTYSRCVKAVRGNDGLLYYVPDVPEDLKYRVNKEVRNGE